MKGLVERANGYLETSFLPGRLFNAQLTAWLQIALPIATQRHAGPCAERIAPRNTQNLTGTRGRHARLIA